jgi:hypothetical protein
MEWILIEAMSDFGISMDMIEPKRIKRKMRKLQLGDIVYVPKSKRVECELPIMIVTWDYNKIPTHFRIPRNRNTVVLFGLLKKPYKGYKYMPYTREVTYNDITKYFHVIGKFKKYSDLKSKIIEKIQLVYGDVI